jgi:hypothetical protein
MWRGHVVTHMTLIKFPTLCLSGHSKPAPAGNRTPVPQSSLYPSRCTDWATSACVLGNNETKYIFIIIIIVLFLFTARARFVIGLRAVKFAR